MKDFSWAMSNLQVAKQEESFHNFQLVFAVVYLGQHANLFSKYFFVSSSLCEKGLLLDSLKKVT